jgi:3-phosphoshikimate 1-carboxyvinyltransferase
MNLRLQISKVHLHNEIRISGSKSETNRLLLLQALRPNLTLENTSDSDDSIAMRQALSTSDTTIDIHHAGTAMRFLTAYFAIQQNREIILTGSQRMQERPISILVDALRQLGADIQYEKNEGFPPLRIKGKKLSGNQVTLAANVSQYISALLLIGSSLENGLELTLEGEITSIPYINMTLALLAEVGIETTFVGNRITVFPHSQFNTHHSPFKITVESDWSSASYFYSIVALSEIGTQITLSSFRKNSFQGDSALAQIYTAFGVETIFGGDQITIKKQQAASQNIELNLNHTPDIAQTIAVTAFALGLRCHLTGLHTLQIKETDRLAALQSELTKLGATVTTTPDSLTLEASATIQSNISIKTYNDHRMAMAFAPLALKVPIVIEDAGVVSKSYPAFWDDLKKIGFNISEV